MHNYYHSIVYSSLQKHAWPVWTPNWEWRESGTTADTGSQDGLPVILIFVEYCFVNHPEEIYKYDNVIINIVQ